MINCHQLAELKVFLIPIVVNGLVVAHLQCGQVTECALTVEDWRRVRARLGRLNGLTGSLRRVYYRAPVVPAERQRDIVALLRLFAQHAALAHIWRMELDQALLIASIRQKRFRASTPFQSGDRPLWGGYLLCNIDQCVFWRRPPACRQTGPRPLGNRRGPPAPGGMFLECLCRRLPVEGR